MPDLTTLGLFVSAAFILSITPGPGLLYTLARTLHGGKTAGISSAFGLFVGGLFHIAAAAVGISSLLMTSAVAFSVVKYVGAAYLIYLGIRTLLSPDIPPASTNGLAEPERSGNVFYQGVLTEILNPKTALFFLAFIPQFITVENGSVFTQFLVLGLITNSFNFLADCTVATFAGPIGQKLRSSYRLRQQQRIASGCTMIGLGTYVAVADQQ